MIMRHAHRSTAARRACRARLAQGLAACGLALLSGTAAAHHSFAGYDLERALTVEGTVAKYDWRNPHVELTVRDANDVLWRIETDAPATMTASRWSPDSFAPGDLVSVRFNPGRNAAATGLLLSVRGANWVSRGSVARTGAPSSSAATAISVLACIAGLLVIATFRRHRAVGAVAAAALGAGVLVFTSQLAFDATAQGLGAVLLIGGALRARRAAAARDARQRVIFRQT